MTEKFDLIVVGSGSGNAIPEYFAGKKVALIEKNSTFGGTCLNVGCIPSKMFVLPGDVANAVQDSNHLGVDATLHGVDWASIRNRVFGRIDPIAEGGKSYRAEGTPGLELIEGTASFIAEKTLQVNGRTLTADNILLAVGSRPQMPPIAGLAEVQAHTSDTIMRLETFPKRLAIIGGGFIAAEMGHVFSSYGSQVTLFNRSDRLLKAQDEAVSQRFAEVFGKRVALRLGETPTRFSKDENGEITIEAPNGSVVVDAVLVATGRRTNSDLVNTDAGGVATDVNGVIEVDEHMQTSVAGVWAVGDVANTWQLKHVANAEAKVAFWNIANPDAKKTMSYNAVPHAVFSDPQIASVGLTEQAAKEQNINYVVGYKDYGSVAYGWALEDSTSFAKVLLEVGTKKILGAHIIGPQAATLVQPLIAAIAFDQDAEQVAKDMFYIHPALTEVVENALLEGLALLDG